MERPARDLDYGCRSLLQKAVRRGHAELARKVAFHLWEAGWEEWLRTRTAVIAAEEAWPLLANVEAKAGIGNLLEVLGACALAVKDKDAAALAGLAWREEEDLGLPAPVAAEVDAFQAQGQEGFWEQAKAGASDEGQARLVAAAERLAHRGEEGLAMAAAWLALRGVTEPQAAKGPLALPLWVGLDRHTGQGKRALEAGAWEARVGLEQALRVNFWVEGVRCNELKASALWTACRGASLARGDLDEASANALWVKLKPHYLSALRGDLAAFTSHVEALGEPVLSAEQKQLGLF